MPKPHPSKSVDREKCPICGCKKCGCCRCGGPHSLEELKKGHGAMCKNGHRWSYGKDGKAVTFTEEKRTKGNKQIQLKKSPDLPMPDKETLKMLVEFIAHAANKLELGDQPIVVTLLHASPDEPITTGAFNPADKTIRCIIQNRHFIDYVRTIAHEMTHLKQSLEGRTEGEIQEIGGEIEDEANAKSGQIVKEYIKKILTPEQKKHLGLGSF